jgi:hypothetical protein
MLAYINEINRLLHEQYGFPYTHPEGGPAGGVAVPDGEYPMEIDGRIDNILIEGDKIFCRRFENPNAPEL